MSPNNSRSSLGKHRNKIMGLLAILAVTGFVLWGYFMVFPLSSVTPTSTTATIQVDVYNGRTLTEISTSTDVYVWETVNLTGFGSGGLNSTLIFSGKASAVNIVPSNSSCTYVMAYNMTNYFTRWSLLSTGTNTVYLYENPTEADMFINAYNKTDGNPWNGVGDNATCEGADGSLNLTVVLGIGLQDELDADKAIIPLYDYSQRNYTRLMVNFTFNGTMTHSNITLMTKGYNTSTGGNVIKYNTTDTITFFFKDLSITSTALLDFEIEVDTVAACNNVSWGFCDYDNEAIRYPTTLLTESF